MPHTFRSGVSAAPCGYEQLLCAASTGLTPGSNASGNVAVIKPEGAAVRYRDDGTNPTAAIGMPLAIGETLEYTGDLSKLKFIEQVATAKLNITYYDVRPVS